MTAIPEGRLSDEQRHTLARGELLMRWLNERDPGTRAVLQRQLDRLDREARPSHHMPVGGSARDLLR